MKLILSMMMMMMSFIMMFMNHPLTIGLMILMQTMLICLLIGMMIKTYWFSYILFLTFLGGLLVLFIYVSSVASNEMFKLNLNFKFLFIIFYSTMLFTFIYFFIFNQKMFWLNLSNNMMDNDNFFLSMTHFNKISLNKLYNNHTNIFMIILIIYLFISLVAIVKITNIFYGPLRKL